MYTYSSYLFTLTPSLDLDDSLFVPGDRPQAYEPEEEFEMTRFVDRPENYKRTSFMEFVKRVLALQSDSPITKFSLVCHKGVDECLVSDWITKALRRGATDFTLMLLFPSRQYSLPPSIYLESQNLVKLKLGRGKLGLFGNPLFRGDFTFSKLKTLHLDLHSIGRGNRSGWSFALLLSKCPVLEELIVNCMKWHLWDSGSLVSASTLKKLTIDSGFYFSERYSSKDIIDFPLSTISPRSVSFDTPNLLYLNYAEFVACNYPLVKLDSLVEARLDVGLTTTQVIGRDSDKQEVRWDATNLITGMHNVQKLELTSDTLEVISDFCKTIPVFHNLNHLSIESNVEQGWEALPLLLTNCPNLHTLVFHGLYHGVTDGCGDICDCISHSSATSCLSVCPVKILKISEFGATCVEMSLVQHFLNKWPQLEQVIVLLSFNAVQEDNVYLSQVSSALEMVPRASPNCDLKVKLC